MVLFYDPENEESVSAFERGEPVFFPNAEPEPVSETSGWPRGWFDLGLTEDVPAAFKSQTAI